MLVGEYLIIIINIYIAQNTCKYDQMRITWKLIININKLSKITKNII